MSYLKYILVFTSLLLSTTTLHAAKKPTKVAAEPKNVNILFEGWFQVFEGSKKIGYLVERTSFENNKFKYVSLLKTNNADGTNVTESTEETADAKLLPLSSTYVTTVGKEPKIVKINVNKDLMTVVTTTGDAKPVQETKRLVKGTLFSNLLMYSILENKFLKVGNKFDYNAIAEEEGKAYRGTVNIKNREPVKGKPAFRLTNFFKDVTYIIWATDHGEPLLMRQPETNIDVRFAETQKEATSDMTVNTKDLTLLFGKIPGDLTVANAPVKPSTAEKSEDASAQPVVQSGGTIRNMAPDPSNSPSK